MTSAAGQEGAMVFVFSRGWAQREAAVAAGRAPAEAYGLFALRERGKNVEGVDETLPTSPALRLFAEMLQRAYVIPRTGLGYRLHQACAVAVHVNDAQRPVVVATMDSVALPLLRLRKARRLCNPVVYVTIGLSGRIASGRVPPALACRYVGLARSASAILAFTPMEVGHWRRWAPRVPVALWPLGIDSHWWRQGTDAPADGRGAILSAGRDPGRDFPALVRAAAGLPCSTRVIGTIAREQGVVAQPGVTVLDDVPVHQLRQEFHRAAVVALPVRGGGYGSGQTTALQAMAAGRPVVMTDTGWAKPLGLQPDEHFIEVGPGDSAGLRMALRRVLEQPSWAEDVGRLAQTAVARICTPGQQADVLVRTLGEA